MTTKRSRFYCSILVAGILLAGCARSENTAVVRIAYIPFSASLPLFVALDKQLFQKHGVQVEALQFPSSTAAVNALIAGQVDLSFNNNLDVLFSAEAARPGLIKLLFPSFETDDNFYDYILVRTDSSLRMPEDLKGASIGMRSGASDLLIGKLYLKQLLGSYEGLAITTGDPKHQVDALIAGHLDAVFTVDPVASAAIRSGRVRVLVPFYRGKVMNPFPAAATSVRSDFWQNRPDDIHRVYAALSEAIEKTASDDTSRSLFIKYLSIEEPLARAVGVPKFFPRAEDVTSSITQIAELYTQSGVIDGTLRIEQIFLSTSDLSGGVLGPQD